MIDISRERPVSVKRAAAFMDVSQRTIERWFSMGLERTKLGGKVYTSRGALQRFAAACSGRSCERVLSEQDRTMDAFLDRMGA